MHKKRLNSGFVRGVLLLSVFLPGLTIAGEDIKQWLARMDHAVASMSYRGTLVAMRDGHIDTLKVIHRVDDQGVRERIYALDGAPREVLRNRDRVRCLFSEHESIVVTSPLPMRLLPRIPLDKVLGDQSVYEIRAGGQARVAGRPARIIEIEPVDEYRYGRRLWLDKQTAMLLQSELLDERGNTVERLMFANIELGANIQDAELESALKDPEQVTQYQNTENNQSTPAAAERKPSWLPESLPDGFKLSAVGHAAGTDKKGEFEHLLFSDGLASFSIYIEPMSGQEVTERTEAVGAVHVYSGSLDKERITVVGEVPAATVRLIGKHLRRAANPALKHYRSIEEPGSTGKDRSVKNHR